MTVICSSLVVKCYGLHHFKVHIVKVQNYGLYSRNAKAFLNWVQDCTWLQYVKHFRNPLWEYFSTVKISISLYFFLRIIYCKVVQHWLPFYRSVNKYFCTIFRYRISLNKVRGHQFLWPLQMGILIKGGNHGLWTHNYGINQKNLKHFRPCSEGYFLSGCP